MCDTYKKRSPHVVFFVKFLDKLWRKRDDDICTFLFRLKIYFSSPFLEKIEARTSEREKEPIYRESVIKKNCMPYGMVCV